MRLIPLLLLAAATTTAASASPVQLRTDHQQNPLAIDSGTPHFSWRSDATTPGWRQSAYQLLVATSPAKLGAPDVWDSGRLAQSASVDIPYAGGPLAPGTHYVWQVRTWDAAGNATLSEPASFDTAPATWNAAWIRRADPAAETELNDTHWIWLSQGDARHVPAGQQVEFRYTLTLNKAPQSALLHVLARGNYIASVNGTETGRHTGWSAFDAEPITHLLHPGVNEVLVKLSANGDKGFTTAAIAAALRVTDASGHMQRIGSAANWQARIAGTADWQPTAIVGPLNIPFSTGVDRHSAVTGPDRIDTGASLLRKGFRLPAAPTQARLTITALGSYTAFLNGTPVAPANLLDPGFTDFRKRILYQTYDVTALLHAGPNAIAAILAGGWHGSPMTWQGTRFFTGPELLSAHLDITLPGGEHRTLSTDDTWKTAAAPILSAEIYGGEIFDGRMASPDWTSASFNDRSWSPAVASTIPATAKLTAQPDLSIHQTDTLHPVGIRHVGSSYVLDMGQNMVGNVALHVTGPRGATVRLRYAERLNEDGSIYTENLRNAVATDFYTLAGNGSETFTPTFTFHGFRYVELTGFPGTPTTASIDGLVENSLPAKPTLRFSSSSDLLNGMGRLGFWGQRGNFVSIPTDCPQRDERLGWMGDAGVFWRTGSYNFDTASFTRKFMLDVTDDQQPSGDFSDVSPDILDWGDGAPGWADAGVLVPYAAWLQYGDAALLRQHWDAMNRFMAFIRDANPAFLRVNRLGNNYGDWLAPDSRTPQALIATAYWAMLARDMRQMALALHDDTGAAQYATLYEHIRDAYRTAYIHPDGTVEGNTQTAYASTLYAGLEPPALHADMVDRLVKDITAHKNHLTTGFLGTPLLMPVLDENGRADVAFSLLLQDTYPSWGYMVKKGATTWWERWNGDTGDPGMNSYNHYAFGSVMSWVFRRVAGIDSTDGSGFHHLSLVPHFSPDLPSLHTEFDSPYGTVITDWNHGTYTVTLPPNTTATLTLPGKPAVEIGSGTMTYSIH